MTRDEVLDSITGSYITRLAVVSRASDPFRKKSLDARLTVVDGGWSLDFVVESREGRLETMSLSQAARVFAVTDA